MVTQFKITNLKVNLAEIMDEKEFCKSDREQESN